MLKMFLHSALIGIAAFVLAMSILFAWRSFQQPDKTENNTSQTYTQQKTDNITPSKDVEDAIARYNLWLTVFTGVLAVVAMIQIGFLISADATATKAANAAKDAAYIAKTALVTVQRAFVFLDSFDAHVLNNQLIVMPKWRNSGTTPTRFMTNYVNWKVFPGEPPDDFQFPDLDSTGIPVTDATKVIIPTFVGPNATAFADQLTIPTPTMDAVRNGRMRLFIWGWARYQDVFKAHHITRFANEIKFTQVGVVPPNPPPGTKIEVAITFSGYKRHNCTDEECEQQGIP